MKQGLREPTQGKRWPAVGLVVLAGVVAALQVGKVAIGLPTLQADLDFGLGEAGWVMALFALLGTVGGMPAGIAVSRFGDCRLLTGGLLALSMGSGVGAFAGSLPLLLGARVIEGAGFLLILVAAPAVLQRIMPASDRNVAFGVWSTFMPTGIAIALLAGPALEGWRPFWMANAALVHYLVPRGDTSLEAPEAGAMFADIGTVLAARGPVLMALAFATYALQYFAVVSFLPTLLMERMQIPIATAGALSAVAVGANVLGNLAAGMLLSRGISGISTGTLVLVTSVVTGVAGVGIFSAALPNALVFALCVLFSAVGGLLPASVIAGAMRSMPALRLAPAALGLTVHGNNIGQLIGPVAVGAAVSVAGWSAAGVIVGTAGALGAVCGWGIRQADTR